MALVFSVKVLSRLGRNIVNIGLMGGGLCPKNNVMRSLYGGKQMVWTMERIKVSSVEVDVAGVVAEVALEGVLEEEMYPSPPRS